MRLTDILGGSGNIEDAQRKVRNHLRPKPAQPESGSYKYDPSTAQGSKADDISFENQLPEAPWLNNDAPKPWDAGSPAVAEQNKLYEDILGNLESQRDQIVQQGQNSIAGQQRQAAYVSGMLGNSFGAAQASGQGQAFMNANQQMQNNLLRNNQSMQEAQLAMLDRRLQNDRFTAGLGAQDYFNRQSAQFGDYRGDKDFARQKDRIVIDEMADRDATFKEMARKAEANAKFYSSPMAKRFGLKNRTIDADLRRMGGDDLLRWYYERNG